MPDDTSGLLEPVVGDAALGAALMLIVGLALASREPAAAVA